MLAHRAKFEGNLADGKALKQECSATPIEGCVEHYEFTWPGKRAAKAAASAASAKTLRPCREESVDFDKTKNLCIGNGDLFDSAESGQETVSPLDVGFRVLKLDSSSLNDTSAAARAMPIGVKIGGLDGVWIGRESKMGNCSFARLDVETVN